MAFIVDRRLVPLYNNHIYIMESRKTPPLSRSICVFNIASERIIRKWRSLNLQSTFYAKTYVIHSRMITHIEHLMLANLTTTRYSLHDCRGKIFFSRLSPFERGRIRKRNETRHESSRNSERNKSAKKRIHRILRPHRIGHQRDCIYIGF